MLKALRTGKKKVSEYGEIIICQTEELCYSILKEEWR